MATTKRELIEQAYGEMGLAGYFFDIQPEELAAARKRLDRMMAQWESIGIYLGYSMPSNPDDSDLDEDSGLQDGAVDTVATNLCVLLAPSKGKTLSIDTKVAAKNGYNRLLAAKAVIPQKQYPGNLPMGAGNKRLPIDRNYFQPTDQVTGTENGSVIDLGAGFSLPA